MRRLLLPLAASVALCANGATPEPASGPTPVDPVPALPLALDDAFEITKVIPLTVDPSVKGATAIPWMKAEIDRRYFGAINSFERRQREGMYYTVHWKAPRHSDITVRMEYRQQKLGSHVQAMEFHYPDASGNMRTEFAILGDDYYQDGPVTSWRLVLIQRNRIVGVQQSFLW